MIKHFKDASDATGSHKIEGMTRDEFISSKVWPDRCWHVVESGPGGVWQCVKCSHVPNFPAITDNPDFSSESGFFMLLKRMQEHERWHEFHRVLFRETAHGWSYDLIPMQHINPPVFRDAVADFFEWEGKA